MPWTLLFILAVAYAGLCLLMYLLQERFVYFPTRPLHATPADIGLEYEEVSLSAADGTALHGWFVPGRRHSPTLLFFHGNAGNISHRLESLAIFHRLGLNTLVFDYRGYGRSAGSPSEEGTYRDAEAAWRHLTETRRIPPERVVLFGRSLGGAVAAWLAPRAGAGALILESTFTSIPELGAKLYPFLPVRLLARLRYDTLARLPHAGCPVLIVHSRDDEIVPFEHARRLLEAAPEPKRLLELRGGHNDGFLVSGERYVEGLAAFLDTHLGTRRTGAAP